MFVDFKSLGRWIIIALIAVAIWLMWWSQPERQVRRAQKRFFGAMESRDYEALAQILADDYRDGWEHDKAFVLQQAPRVLDQFLLLDIEGEIQDPEEQSPLWLVRQKVVITGMGGALAMYARDEVNKLQDPFTMTWRKKSWKPWDWELIRIEQPQLRIPTEF